MKTTCDEVEDASIRLLDLRAVEVMKSLRIWPDKIPGHLVFHIDEPDTHEVGEGAETGFLSARNADLAKSLRQGLSFEDLSDEDVKGWIDWMRGIADSLESEMNT